MNDDDLRWYAPGYHRDAIPREQLSGDEVWRLVGDGDVHTCELFDPADGAESAMVRGLPG